MAGLWIARDMDGSLWMFNEKPVKQGDEFRSPFYLTGGSELMMDSSLYPELTWENSPKELTINTE